jgi:hypothetical protein
MKKNTGSRWEVTVDGKPRTYSHDKPGAITSAQHLKLKNPVAEVTVRDGRAGASRRRWPGRSPLTLDCRAAPRPGPRV